MQLFRPIREPSFVSWSMVICSPKLPLSCEFEAFRLTSGLLYDTHRVDSSHGVGGGRGYFICLGLQDVIEGGVWTVVDRSHGGKAYIYTSMDN